MPAPVESRRRVRLVGRTKTMGMAVLGTKTGVCGARFREHVCEREMGRGNLQDENPRVLRLGQGQGRVPLAE